MNDPPGWGAVAGSSAIRNRLRSGETEANKPKRKKEKERRLYELNQPVNAKQK